MNAHRSRVRVRFYELDPYNHVNHSVYVQYFEAARVDLLEAAGYGLDRLLEDDAALVVTNLATRFMYPASLGDELVIETGLVSASRVRSRWAQRMSLAEERDVVVCTQIIDFATTNREGKPRRLPEGLTDTLAPFAVGEDWLGTDAPR